MVIILSICGTALATGETATAETKLASAGEPVSPALAERGSISGKNL
jgi:hypothetical protein